MTAPTGVLAVPSDPTPALIKRNTLWLALTQMFVGTGTQFTSAMGPLMVLSLLGSPAFAGLSVGLIGVTRLVASHEFGRITDRFGRKPGMFLALGFALAGALVIGSSMQAGSFPGLVVGMVLFALGMNGVQQLRLAAAEMYPPGRRALVLGIMLTGSLAGVLLAPSIIGFAYALSPTLGMNGLALPWFVFPALIVPAAILVTRVRPDPRDIAADLGRYYPGYLPPPSEATAFAVTFGLREFLAHPHRRVAAATMLAAQAAMQMAMVTVPLQLTHHGYELPAVALSTSIHAAEMFGPSLPMGRLIDRMGRGSLLVAGAVVEAVGAGVATFTSDHASITLGIFLVGVGWCAANVSSTAMVIDSTPTSARGRAVGLLDSITAAGVLLPLSVGVLVEVWGLQMAGTLAMFIVVLPLFLRRFLVDGSPLPWPAAREL
ncbi:MAG: MFS transporter [Candidatus Limnocylindria bacterium]|nr:MFS transporter [Candidatus Limnocylindria bacterium]